MVENSWDGIKWLREPGFNPETGEQTTAGIDEHGREWGDPVPTAPPIGFERTVDPVYEMVRSLVRRHEFERAVEAEGFETFEESEDFDVEDDDLPVDPKTPYEAVFDPPPEKVPAPPSPAAPVSSTAPGPPPVAPPVTATPGSPDGPVTPVVSQTA